MAIAKLSALSARAKNQKGNCKAFFIKRKHNQLKIYDYLLKGISDDIFCLMLMSMVA